MFGEAQRRGAVGNDVITEAGATNEEGSGLSPRPQSKNSLNKENFWQFSKQRDPFILIWL